MIRDALGEDSRKNINPVEAKLENSNNVDMSKLKQKIEWLFLEDKAGTLTPNVNNKCKADHLPPKTAEFTDPNEPKYDTLAVKLTINNKISIMDKKQVALFKDHLARDVANFRHGKKCAASVGGIQLAGADDLQVKEVSLTCGPSMGHAHEGTSLDAGLLWAKLKGEKWEEKEFTLESYQKEQVERTWKIWLYNNNGTEKLHPATIFEKGNGKNAKTYAGDSLSKEFRHETAESYFAFLRTKGWIIVNPSVKVLKPSSLENKGVTENE